MAVFSIRGLRYTGNLRYYGAMQVLWIFLAGGLGSVGRYGVSRAAALLQAQNFWATLTANAIGCLIIGFLAAVFEARALSPELRAVFVTGFLGGFTTFSTFGLETLQFFRQGQTGAGILNIALNLVLGLGFAALGMAIGHGIHRN